MGGLFYFRRMDTRTQWWRLAEFSGRGSATRLATWRCSTLAKIAKCQLGTIPRLSFEPSRPARLWLLSHGQSRGAAHEAGKRHCHDRLGYRHPRKQGPARLFDDQGRHPRLHQVAVDASCGSRHQGERGSARPGADAAQPCRQAGGSGRQIRWRQPMRRPAQPEEIAPAFVFLAAPACSSYITGEILPIIGGYIGG